MKEILELITWAVIMVLVVAVLIIVIFVPIELIENYRCGRLSTDVGYSTSYSWANDCYIEFKGEWYPEDVFYTVLGNDYQLEIELDD